MRTIIFFDQSASVGGGQIVLLSLIEAAHGIFDRVIVAAPLGGAFEQRVRERFGDTITLVPIKEVRLTIGRKTLADVPRFISYNLSLLRYWRLVRKANLVYVNGGRVILGAMLLSVLCRRSCLYHLHVDHSQLEKLLFLLAARLPWTAGILANSEFNLKKFQAACPSLAEDPCLFSVENALDRRYANLRFVDRFTTPRQSLRVLVAGTLTPEKGQDMAVELARRLPAIEMYLVGSIYPSAEVWVAGLRNAAPVNVIFHGAVTDMPALIDRLGIHVNLVPSRYEEAFGLVSIEGMASSCITLVSGRGALPDIAAKTGAIVCEHIDAMTAELDRLVAMPADQLTLLARSQFEATMIAYAPDRYIEEVSLIMRAAMASA